MKASFNKPKRHTQLCHDYRWISESCLQMDLRKLSALYKIHSRAFKWQLDNPGKPEKWLTLCECESLGASLEMACFCAAVTIF